MLNLPYSRMEIREIIDRGKTPRVIALIPSLAKKIEYRKHMKTLRLWQPSSARRSNEEKGK